MRVPVTPLTAGAFDAPTSPEEMVTARLPDGAVAEMTTVGTVVEPVSFEALAAPTIGSEAAPTPENSQIVYWSYP